MKQKKLSEMSRAELRTLYGKIQTRSSAKDRATFQAAVKAKLAKIPNPTPLQYVLAAQRVSFRCGRCAGTGAFITGSLNGKPTGPGGICYRCEGHGAQNDADAIRNECWDKHSFSRCLTRA